METKTHIILMLSISLIAITIRFLFKGRKDLFSYAILFYFFFTFGPLINHLIGIPIYFGTPLEFIGIAANIFTISIITMCTLSITLSKNDEVEIEAPKNKYQFLLPILIAFSVYSLIQGVLKSLQNKQELEKYI